MADVFPTRTITQLWRSGQRVVSVQSRVISDPSPDEEHSYIEKRDNLRCAFHWGQHQVSPLLLVHLTASESSTGCCTVEMGGLGRWN